MAHLNTLQYMLRLHVMQLTVKDRADLFTTGQLPLILVAYILSICYRLVALMFTS